MFGSGATILAVATAYLARGPEVSLHFRRDVPLQQNQIQRAKRWIENPQRWPQWFHSGSSIEWSSPVAAKELTRGAQARLTVDPKKTTWKRYQIFLTLTSVIRAHDHLEIQLRLDGDSQGKIQRVFKDIHITVRLDDSGIHGSATAMTNSWRTRLTARLSERTVMNQIFYPHLLKLARLADGTGDTEIEGKKSLY